MTVIQQKQNIFELVQTYPEIRDIMADLGFKDILKPGMLQSIGKIMTIEKGAKMKSLPMEVIVQAFEDKGYQLI